MYIKKKQVTLCTNKQKTSVIMKNFNVIAAFVGGAIVGAAAGLLFAPQKGSDLRKKIMESLRKRGIRLNHKEMDNLVDEIAEEIQTEEE